MEDTEDIAIRLRRFSLRGSVESHVVQLEPTSFQNNRT